MSDRTKVISSLDATTLTAIADSFERLCQALGVTSTAVDERKALAARLIDLAHAGVTDARTLYGRVLQHY
jgi:hypothetical protein